METTSPKNHPYVFQRIVDLEPIWLSSNQPIIEAISQMRRSEECEIMVFKHEQLLGKVTLQDIINFLNQDDELFYSKLRYTLAHLFVIKSS